jgi:hypothetical protein
VGTGLGEASIGITAGRGSDGAGDTERREENEDRLLWLMTLGGFIGIIEVGVPGADGTGDPIDTIGVDSKAAKTDLWPMSGGAGLFDEIRRGGRSALLCMATFGVLSSWLVSVYWPSFVFKE